MIPLISNTDSISFQEPKPIVLKDPKKAVFTLQHVHVNTEAGKKSALVKTVREVLNVWRDVMAARFKTTGDDADLKVAASYESLIDSLDGEAAELLKKSGNKGRHIMILSDSQGQIQAVATLKERVEKIGVDTLLSAPWNVPMKSEVHPDHKKLKVSGAGTTMIRQVYELAKLKEKSKIEMRPIDTARSFYVNTLKMSGEDGDAAVYFMVTDECPETLNVPSGNLLERPQ